MCEKCVELDEKIFRLRDLAERAMDDLTTTNVGKLIEEMLAEKVLLHPKEAKEL